MVMNNENIFSYLVQNGLLWKSDIIYLTMYTKFKKKAWLFCHVNFRVFHIDVLVGSLLSAHRLIFNIYPVKSRGILTDT